MVEPLTGEEFLDRKRDYSPLLVHLTKDSTCYNPEDDCEYPISAKDVLDIILSENTLRAFNHFCLFSPNLEKQQKVSLEDKFKVVCFTETPIDQINILLMDVSGRNFKPESYGLVFKKEYVRQQEGNPVFYTTKEVAHPLWSLYWQLCDKEIEQVPDEVCRLLALVTLCDESMDFHWEREWRLVGDLKFNLNDIYCCLCPEEHMTYFKNKYSPVHFIDPNWGINKILDKLVRK